MHRPASWCSSSNYASALQVLVDPSLVHRWFVSGVHHDCCNTCIWAYMCLNHTVNKQPWRHNLMVIPLRLFSKIKSDSTFDLNHIPLQWCPHHLLLQFMTYHVLLQLKLHYILLHIMSNHSLLQFLLCDLSIGQVLLFLKLQMKSLCELWVVLGDYQECYWHRKPQMVLVL